MQAGLAETDAFGALGHTRMGLAEFASAQCGSADFALPGLCLLLVVATGQWPLLLLLGQSLSLLQPLQLLQLCWLS
jgi:hypothetical protein